MNILWLSWKDIEHPLSGGAELVSTEIRKRLILDGHSVRLITSRPDNSDIKSVIDGVEIYRTGNKYTVYTKAKKLYKKSMGGWADLIIDEMNTIPFLGFKYDKMPTVLLTYQLARQVWFYQMIFPFSLAGYLLEPLLLRYLSRNKYNLVLTESDSTKKDLAKYGFRQDAIKTFRIGMNIKTTTQHAKKSTRTIISLGSVRPMKRTLHIIKAFELAVQKLPDLILVVVGDYSGKYGKRVFAHAKKSNYSDSIKFYGKVDEKAKEQLLRDSAIIVITSVKEGWGIIATEAASQGVPAVAYDTDGLRDSVLDGKTGLLAKSGNFVDLSLKITKLLEDPKRLEKMRDAGIENSRQFTFDNSYEDFVKCLGIIKQTGNLGN